MRNERPRLRALDVPLAVGTWISIIGVGIVLIAIVGWTYEYYRGNFAR